MLSMFAYDRAREDDARHLIRWFAPIADGWAFRGTGGKTFALPDTEAKSIAARARRLAQRELIEPSPFERPVVPLLMACATFVACIFSWKSGNATLFPVSLGLLLFSFFWISWQQVISLRLRLHRLRRKETRRLKSAGIPEFDLLLRRLPIWRIVQNLCGAALTFSLLYWLYDETAWPGLAGLVLFAGAWGAYFMAEREHLALEAEIAPLLIGWTKNSDARRRLRLSSVRRPI